MNRGLPTFEETRRRTHRLLGDASDELRSDWAEGTGPTRRQAEAMRRAQEHIGRAKAALDDAARR
jgi:hypothetical protein